jgi:hypothetical protein
MTTHHQQPPPVSQRRDAGRVRVAATTPGTRRPTRQPDREQRHTGGRGVGEVVTPAASTPSECARRPTITKPAKSNRFTSSTTASRFPPGHQPIAGHPWSRTCATATVGNHRHPRVGQHRGTDHPVGRRILER